MPAHIRTWHRAAWLALCLGLSACALSNNALKSVNVVAEAEANLGHATAFDLVFVYDDAALQQLPKTGPDWFRQKAALQQSLATGMEVLSLELPPATRVSAPLPQQHRKAVAVLGFANYFPAAGQAPMALQGYRRVTIHLLAEGVKLEGE